MSMKPASQRFSDRAELWQRREKKEVGAITACERGELVNLSQAVNILVNGLPLFFIVFRVHFKDCFIHEGPPGCIGKANSSG